MLYIIKQTRIIEAIEKIWDRKKFRNMDKKLRHSEFNKIDSKIPPPDVTENLPGYYGSNKSDDDFKLK